MYPDLSAPEKAKTQYTTPAASAKSNIPSLLYPDLGRNGSIVDGGGDRTRIVPNKTVSAGPVVSTTVPAYNNNNKSNIGSSIFGVSSSSSGLAPFPDIRDDYRTTNYLAGRYGALTQAPSAAFEVFEPDTGEKVIFVNSLEPEADGVCFRDPVELQSQSADQVAADDGDAVLVSLSGENERLIKDETQQQTANLDWVHVGQEEGGEDVGPSGPRFRGPEREARRKLIKEIVKAEAAIRRGRVRDLVRSAMPSSAVKTEGQILDNELRVFETRLWLSELTVKELEVKLSHYEK
jgi:hypothetical protein